MAVNDIYAMHSPVILDRVAGDLWSWSCRCATSAIEDSAQAAHDAAYAHVQHAVTDAIAADLLSTVWPESSQS